ncbi:hypothetical protein [Brevundimonas albigilva]|uniref:Phage tail protein n=1 Tax=Brevundimonas albigilva TaxID=1312364 RepID=A0ABY4SQQ0_9CAUL|nr:hypothetical protein [Brevundimonas albigilva]URI15922.1 hypothetical protein M8231_02720 [Brevundimonas albigilva]
MPAPTISDLPTPPSRGDAPDVFASRADAFLGALPNFADETNAVGAYVDDKADEIENIVANAGYVGTSTSTVTLGTGSKSFTTQADLAYIPGVYVAVVDSTAPTVNSMIGVVTAYNGDTGALTINSLLSKGTGDVSTWAISLSGPPGSDATVTKSAVEAAVGGPVALRTDTTVTISGTTHTLDEADNGKVHRFTSSTAVTITMPNSLSEGWNAIWRQVGAGQLTFSTGSGATRRNRLGHTKSAGQYAEGALAVDSNSGGASAVYYFSGDTAP